MNDRLYVLILCASCLLLSACQEMEEDSRREKAATARWEMLDQKIKSQGYAQVGQMPHGEPLFMRYGEGSDRIYFTDHSIAAHEYCGKGCQKTIVGPRQ